MNDVASLIKRHIQESGYNVYTFSQRANINRATLQKALTGDRKLSSECFAAVVSALNLSPVEKAELENAFLIYRIGEDNYNNRMFVLELLKTDYSEILKKSKGPHQEEATICGPLPLVEMLHGSYNILRRMEQCICQGTSGHICSYSIFSKAFFQPLRNLCDGFTNRKLTISHLLMLDKKHGDSDKCGYNIQTFSDIIPYLLQNRHEPDVHYFYGDAKEFFSPGSMFPCYFIIDNCVFLLQEHFQEGILLTDPALVEYYQKQFYLMYSQGHKLIHLQKDVSLSMAYTESQKCAGKEKQSHHAIEWQPCVGILSDSTLLNKYIILPPDKKKAGINQLLQRKESFKKYGANLYFSKEGIDLFAREGISYGMYPDSVEKYSPKDRITVLEQLLNMNRRGKIHNYMLSPSILSDMQKISIMVEEPNDVYFGTWLDRDLIYYRLNENTLYDVFRDFVEHMSLHGIAEELTETNAYVQQLIQELKAGKYDS